MTRGKYTARASSRRDAAAVRSEIGSYQHHIKRLTAENKQLRSLLDEERHSRKEENRFLRAMRDEGLSPEVMALREELERQRSVAVKAQAETQRQREVKDKVFDFTTSMLRIVTGCTGLEALECLLGAITGDDRIIADVDDRKSELSAGQVHAIQQGRGARSNPKIQAELDRLVGAARAETGRRRRRGAIVRSAE